MMSFSSNPRQVSWWHVTLKMMFLGSLVDGVVDRQHGQDHIGRDEGRLLLRVGGGHKDVDIRKPTNLAGMLKPAVHSKCHIIVMFIVKPRSIMEIRAIRTPEFWLIPIQFLSFMFLW